MHSMASTDRSRSDDCASLPSTDVPSAHELWRVRGATDDLRGLAIETSFGYAVRGLVIQQ